jgi:hypothetical protein
MKVRTRSRVLAVAISLGVLLPGCAGYSACKANGTGKVSHLKATESGVSATTRNVNASLPAQVNDVVMEWNQQAVRLTLLPAAGNAPVQQTRVMAIVQLAVHDAVNGITHKYATYLSPGPAPENASPEAAAIAASYYTLRNLFENLSSEMTLLDAYYLESLAAHELSEGDPGVEYGRNAAMAILAARADDHSAQAQFNYNAPGAGTPGVWVRLNNAAALLPGWGSVTPFAMRSGSQFRPDPPVALDSEQYAKDYNEIKVIGASNSSTRTSEQTQIAQFWRASPTAIWNPVLSQVIATRDLDLSAKARAYGLFYLAAADASIACWEAKYTYNFWRPQLAIRGGDADGNDFTAGDATWSPLLSTPPHPEYPSGHTANSGAMAAVLELLFGDDPGAPFAVTLSGITRQWNTFDEAVQEVIDARVYSGIHFRTSDEVGARMGRQVAHFASTHALRPCPRGRTECP